MADRVTQTTWRGSLTSRMTSSPFGQEIGGEPRDGKERARPGDRTSIRTNAPGLFSSDHTFCHCGVCSGSLYLLQHSPARHFSDRSPSLCYYPVSARPDSLSYRLDGRSSTALAMAVLVAIDRLWSDDPGHSRDDLATRRCASRSFPRVV